MAYTAWSVVFGEQPTAAKWNQLGQNDAGFKDGTNIDNLAILTRHIADSNVTGAKIGSYRTRRQDNTTNSDETSALVQTGWGRITMTAAAYNTKAVTFPTAFSSIPIVLVVHGGDRSAAQGAGNYGQGGNNVHGLVMGACFAPSTTGFTAKMGATSGNYAAGDTVYFQWIAIGV